jgi:hypothetical protein
LGYFVCRADSQWWLSPSVNFLTVGGSRNGPKDHLHMKLRLELMLN